MDKKTKLIFGSIAIVALLIAGYFYIDSILFDGVKPKSINANGFKATFFSKDDLENQTAIVLIGGGDWGDYWGRNLQKQTILVYHYPITGRKDFLSIWKKFPWNILKKQLIG